MERQEPRFDKDMKDVEFRPHAYRGSSLPSTSRGADGFAWKIGVAVGVGVLAALLVFNAYERYQGRRDAAQALRLLEQETAKLELKMQTALRSPTPSAARPAATIHPIPPGYRCAGGTLLHRSGNGWSQITARSNHIYCPHEGTSVNDCYPVTPRSVGCVR